MLFILFRVDDLQACRDPLEELLVLFGALHELLMLLHHPLEPVAPGLLSVRALLLLDREILS